MSVTYRCNRCGREEVLTYSGSLRDADNLIRSWGWTVKQSGQNTVCPTCETVASALAAEVADNTSYFGAHTRRA